MHVAGPMVDAMTHTKASTGGGASRRRPRARTATVPRQVPCGDCALCCTYVAVEVPAPDTVENASEMLWYLYHEGVSVHVSVDGWMVQFATRCRNLDEARRCRIYAERPISCREYDERECDVNAADEFTAFYAPAEFLAYLERHHADVYRWLRAKFVPDAAAVRRAGPRGQASFARRLATLRAAGGR